MTAAPHHRLADEAAQSWRMLAERIEQEADERARANLAIVADHVEKEVLGDIPALMATLVPDPVYTFSGVEDPLVGRDAVRASYEATIAAGLNRLEFHLSCVAADASTVVTEGRFRQVWQGSALAAIGLPQPIKLTDDGWYVVEYNAVVLWPISPEGLIEGERVYFGGPPQAIRQIGADELRHLGPAGRAAG